MARFHLCCTDGAGGHPPGERLYAQVAGIRIRIHLSRGIYIYGYIALALSLSSYVCILYMCVCMYLVRCNLRCTDAGPAGAEALDPPGGWLRAQVYIYTDTPLSLSLCLYMCVYIYIYICIYLARFNLCCTEGAGGHPQGGRLRAKVPYMYTDTPLSLCRSLYIWVYMCICMLNLRCTDAGPAGAEALAVTLMADGCALRYICTYRYIYLALSLSSYLCMYMYLHAFGEAQPSLHSRVNPG